MISSKLEPADARRIFPCWDEPAFKATFALDVTVPQNFLAVGNMPVAHEEPVAPDLKRVAFAPTPKMSSYLFVLTAGELERITAEVDGVTVGVVTTAGKSGQGRFALDNAVKLLAWYNDYFGVKYPLPKLDLIAVPGGFGGAMENWGGITFFESRLLFDPATNAGHRAARHFQRAGARDGASMVRRSRHHGLVGQPLAQRGLCQLDAGEGGCAFLSAMEDLAQRLRPKAIRDDARRAAHLASDPAAGRRPERGDDRLRRHHLQQGPGLDPDAGKLSRRRRVSRRHPPLHGRARLWQHHHRRSLAGAGRRGRQDGRWHRRLLHRAGRRAADLRRNPLQRRRPAHDAAAGSICDRARRYRIVASRRGTGKFRSRSDRSARRGRPMSCCSTAPPRSRRGLAARPSRSISATSAIIGSSTAP